MISGVDVKGQYVLKSDGYISSSNSSNWDVDESLQPGCISIETCWITVKAVGNSTGILFHTRSMWPVAYYTVFQNKLYPFYFCNNFFIRKPIFIIFGKNVAKEIGNMQSLTWLLLTVQMSYSWEPA